MEHVQVAIIGAGPGGHIAAIRSSQLGLSTVVIEEDKIGGTCLNVGCIPTKTLAKNAEIIHEIREANKRGILVGPPEINISDTMKMKNRVVSQLTNGVEMLLRANNVTIMKGKAVVESEHKIIVGDATISCENMIIATGSSNYIPPIPGLDIEGILTSTELLEIDHIPNELCIIGGGVIGCELASIFQAFGTRVIIVEMLSRLLPNLDAEVSTLLRKSMIKDGIAIKTNCRVAAISKNGDRYRVEIAGEAGESLEVDEVMVSVGRRPNLCGLEGLELDLEKGYIKTDEHLRTSKSGVYAIGDVTGKNLLAHVASAQGIVAAENIAGKESKMNYDVVPNCIYTIPEIGSVGLTEECAAAAGYDVIIGKFPMGACGRALAMGVNEGFTKLIADKSSGRVLGASVVGPYATEIIGELTYVVNNGGTLDDIKHTIHAHPTITETILEAAHVALGEPIYIK